MGKKAAKIAKLKAKIKALKAKLAAEKGNAPKISPLAPKAGFPKLPAIKGVRFGAAAAGVKYQNRDDVMLAELAPNSTIAGVFTTSSTRSAPVLDCQAKLSKGISADQPIAIVVNSGNSNAFTGGAGQLSVHEICKATAAQMNTSPDNVFTASTGVIGEPLPHERIVSVLAELHKSLDEDRAEDAARAIMTTDTFAKGACATARVGGVDVNIAGFAKGSGMIAPDMATMLVYIFTDAAIDAEVLQAMLSELNETSFNAITVDSDTSTSDSLMLAATGQSGAAPIMKRKSEDADVFVDALRDVMRDLAHQVVKDGEGATKFVTVNVTGAKDDDSAKRIGLAIANSPLVKTAIAGEDPNWGRIVMAVGKSGEPADRDKLQISFGDIVVAENGWVAEQYREDQGAAYMKNPEIMIQVDVGINTGKSTIWTCDLTHQYVTINADYRS